jgi:hypothetical protein
MSRISTGVPRSALDHQALDVGLAAQVALTAHHVLGLGHLDHAAADVAVGVADHLRHLHQRHAVAAQLDRIDRDLVRSGRSRRC